MKKEKWARLQDQDIFLYTLEAGSFSAQITNYGATLTHFFMPDKQGEIGDIVLGFHDGQSYLKPHPFFGATIGRFGNRIAGAQFELNGKTYHLSKNEGENQLHGGFKGFDKQIWAVDILSPSEGEAIKLTYISPDGEEGFPGTLKAEVTYHLFDDGRLLYDVQAISDADTVCSIVNHSYFNLAGSGDILDHTLWLNASHYTEVDHELIPTGKMIPVKDTGLDFTNERLLKDGINEMEKGSYDHNLICDHYNQSLQKVAQLKHEKSGRSLEVFSTLPCLQLYNSSTMAQGKLKGKNGEIYPDFAGLCLETQFAPNSMNIASFDQPLLKKGELWTHQTLFHFSYQ